MWFAGQGGEGLGYFGEGGFDVGGGCACGGGVGVAGEGAGGGVAAVALDPGEGCVPEPAGGYLLRRSGDVLGEGWGGDLWGSGS